MKIYPLRRLYGCTSFLSLEAHVAIRKHRNLNVRSPIYSQFSGPWFKAVFRCDTWLLYFDTVGILLQRKLRSAQGLQIRDWTIAAFHQFEADFAGPALNFMISNIEKLMKKFLVAVSPDTTFVPHHMSLSIVLHIVLHIFRTTHTQEMLAVIYIMTYQRVRINPEAPSHWLTSNHAHLVQYQILHCFYHSFEDFNTELLSTLQESCTIPLSPSVTPPVQRSTNVRDIQKPYQTISQEAPVQSQALPISSQPKFLPSSSTSTPVGFSNTPNETLHPQNYVQSPPQYLPPSSTLLPNITRTSTMSSCPSSILDFTASQLPSASITSNYSVNRSFPPRYIRSHSEETTNGIDEFMKLRRL